MTRNNNLFTNEQKALITLPPRNDTESEVITEWDFGGGILDFDGQRFNFPEGYHVRIRARWIEEALLLADMSVSAEIESECARCLKPVSLEISEKLMYLYYPHNSEEFEDDGYMPVEVDYFGRVLDVMPQVQESIYTLLPTKVLCREDCKGLCPECGADLNEGPCSCKTESIDPRLEVLRSFVET